MSSSIHQDPNPVQDAIASFGPWFHNLHLPSGIQTAPQHQLGDFPRNKWLSIADHVPPDLSGWKVLDIGCNAGFYTFELAKRGATVTAIDCDEHYLAQARWAAEQYDMQGRVTFRNQQVYDLAEDSQQYDLVWFMGVFYHLRYPLLALDILARKTTQKLVFQTMTMPGTEILNPPDNVDLADRDGMLEPGWPKMAFVEKLVANDPTNWWAANAACVEAMLRSSSLRIVAHPAHEVYICEPDPDSKDRWGVADINEQQYLAATGLRRTGG